MRVQELNADANMTTQRIRLVEQHRKYLYTTEFNIDFKSRYRLSTSDL